jgi:NTP pyrophosphatase (non-canonical NTP hydrolase)
MKCTAYEIGKLWDYKYVVTFANYNGDWIFCKHKDTDTWEASGGRIEPGEYAPEAASRLLRADTGALDFEIEPVCDYWASDEPHETKNLSWSNGAVFLAAVHSVGDLPDGVTERIGIFDELPSNLTNPDIMNTIFPYAFNMVRQKYQDNASDLKISELIEMQKTLQDKHKGDLHPLTPDYGRNSVLWMIEEIGEIVSIIKKRGETNIMLNKIVRDAFVEEFADVLMYMTDALISYGVNASEFANAYKLKHKKNMDRDWSQERSVISHQKS